MHHLDGSGSQQNSAPGTTTAPLANPGPVGAPLSSTSALPASAGVTPCHVTVTCSHGGPAGIPAPPLCTPAPVPSYEAVESVLPRDFRARLHKLFGQIEREFEREYRKLYAENIALQERLEEGEHAEPNFLAKKLGASQISQRIKQQYKQSTSRLVSTLRPSAAHQSGSAAGGWQLGCRLSGHRDGVWEVTAHRRLVGSASADGTVRLWTNDSGSCLLLYTGHLGSVNSVRFRDDLMLTASGDGSAHLVLIPHDLLHLINTGTTAAGSDGPFASLAGGGSTSVPQTGAGGSSAGQGSGPNDSVLGSAAPQPGSNVGAGVGAGVVLPSSASGGSLQLQGPGGAEGSDLQPVSLDGVLAATEVDNVNEDSPTTMIVRHPHAMFQSASLPSLGLATPVTTSAPLIDLVPLAAADFLSATRDQIVTASWDRLGRIYDLSTGQEVSALTGHDHQLTDVRCAPGGQQVAVTSSKDSTFRLWDFRKSGGAEVHIQQGHSQIVSTAQFLGDLQPEKLVSCGTDRLCKLWDLRQCRGPLLTIRTDSPINRLAVHPAGTVLALPMDNRNVKFFDLLGNRLGRLPRSSSQGHARMVTSVSWAGEDGSSGSGGSGGAGGRNNFFSAAFDHFVLGWHINFPLIS